MFEKLVIVIPHIFLIFRITFHIVILNIKIYKSYFIDLGVNHHHCQKRINIFKIKNESGLGMFKNRIINSENHYFDNYF